VPYAALLAYRRVDSAQVLAGKALGAACELCAAVCSRWWDSKTGERGIRTEVREAARLGLSLGDAHECQACAVRNGALLPGVGNG
jgi:hypothetical protein